MQTWQEISAQYGEATPRRRPRRPAPTPRVKVRGKEEVAVPIGFLANALGRSSATIKQWELKLIFPPAPCRSPGRRKDRLYPLPYVERVLVIAKEEGILDGKVADFRRTRFESRVWAVFWEFGFHAPLPNGCIRVWRSQPVWADPRAVPPG